MNVRVHYTTQLKTAIGRPGEQIAFPAPPTIEAMLQRLSELHGKKFDEFIWNDSGEIRKSMLICLGDDCVSGNLTMVLNDGDEITLLAPVSGG